MTAARRIHEEEPGLKPWHVTAPEYWRMVDAGLFEGRRVQLIEGVIVEMSPMKSPHAIAVSNLTRLLQIKLGARWSVRVQVPLEVGGDSVPEPDIAALPLLEERRALPSHPRTAPLVCEVSDSTLLFDREEKLPLYARASVPEYVIANVRKHELELYTRPVKAEARYGRRDVIGAREIFRSKATPAVLKVRDVFAGCP